MWKVRVWTVYEDGLQSMVEYRHMNSVWKAIGDMGFDSSWSWCTRRCEVIRIGDRDYAGQIRVIQADESAGHLDTP